MSCGTCKPSFLARCLGPKWYFMREMKVSTNPFYVDNVLEFIYQTPFIVDLFMSMMKIESISPQIMLVFGNMARSGKCQCKGTG